MHVHEIVRLLQHEACNHVYYNIYCGLLISHNRVAKMRRRKLSRRYASCKIQLLEYGTLEVYASVVHKLYQ